VSRNWSTSELADVYRRQGSPNPITDACADRPSKYNAKKTVVEGITFDSAKEAQDYQMLRIVEGLGHIRHLELQPVYLLQAAFRENGKHHRAITYRADFRFQRGGKTVVVDRKGFKTAAYKIKAKLFRAKYPDIEFEEWTQ
jgi:hypothetical protein